MIYSCAYWVDAGSLDDAQERKLDLVCRKLGLKDGQRLLDVGCGWEALPGSRPRGTASPSLESPSRRAGGSRGRQVRELPGGDPAGGLPGPFGTFDARRLDRMFEHVGPRHPRDVPRSRPPMPPEDGLFLLHTIGTSETTAAPDPWI